MAFEEKVFPRHKIKNIGSEIDNMTVKLQS